jgi:aryl-alcohol dehydrogenase-like predicted oxidoreductase
MVKLIEEGKVRAAGVSNFTVELLERCEAIRHVDSLQPLFSMVSRAAAEKLLPWCKRNNTGVICYSPMQSGILTDGFTKERVAKMASDDWRRRGPEFQEPALSRNLALRDALRPIADRHNVSVSAVAIAWTLAWPGLTGAIVGARTPAQVGGWIEAATLQLTQDDLAEVAAAIARTQAGSGPSPAPKSAASSGGSTS